jgi:hypothetical protein
MHVRRRRLGRKRRRTIQHRSCRRVGERERRKGWSSTRTAGIESACASRTRKIEAWIDDDKKFEVETKGKLIALRPGDIQKSLPLGIASYMTRAALRDIRLRRFVTC